MPAHNTRLLSVCFFVTACTLGQNAEEWGVAKQPAGANATVITRTTTVKGELIEVRSDGMVLLRDDRTMALAPFTAITRVEVRGLGSDYVVNETLPMTADKKVRFALVSHFPQGMPTAARNQLLATARQKELTVIE